MHALLRNPVYAGRQRFNVKDSRTFKLKPASEHVYCDAPAIVSNEVFEQAQAKLRLHNPRVTPARVVNGPTLLAGLAVCATCGARMIIRTGTSHTGTMFRYYSCSNFLKKGRMACRGRNMRMERLDKLVIEGLEGDLLEPGRLSAMLNQLDGMLAERAAAVSRRLAALAREAEDADDRLRRLYKLVEEGRAELDDLLSDRIADLKRARERAHAALERARSATPSTGEADSPIAIERFTRAMRERLTGGTIQFRRAYLGSLIGRIEVDDHEVRICGQKQALEQAILATRQGSDGVLRSVPNWRPRQGSNLRPST